MSEDLMKHVIEADDIQPFEMPKGFFVRLLAAVEDYFSVVLIEAEPGERFDVVHPEAELVFVLEGVVEYEDGRVVRAGQAVINLPNVVHRGRIAGEKRARFIEVKAPPPQVYLDNKP